MKFRDFTYYKEASASGRGKPTDKQFTINMDHIETITEYGDHCKITMVSGLTFCVCESRLAVLQK